jgi:hypothetical protein
MMPIERGMRSSILTVCLVSLFLTACVTEWSYKLPPGSERFTAVPDEQVEILFGPPSRPFEQVGIVSALGSAFSSDIAMYKKLRKAAADLGADALIISDQSQGFVGVPAAQSTVLAGNTAITTGGSYAIFLSKKFRESPLSTWSSIKRLTLLGSDYPSPMLPMNTIAAAIKVSSLVDCNILLPRPARCKGAYSIRSRPLGSKTAQRGTMAPSPSSHGQHSEDDLWQRG